MTDANKAVWEAKPDNMDEIVRNPNRNFLYDFLQKGEDTQFPAEPDCADLPYFLRAYFAWKLGLPIAYRACNRGSTRSAPRCERSGDRPQLCRHHRLARYLPPGQSAAHGPCVTPAAGAQR